VELFRKKDSRFYWYDFKARGKRYRGSTKETNKKRVGRIAALRLSQAIEGTGLLDRKAPSLQELSTRFLGWVESTALASKTRKYYANGAKQRDAPHASCRSRGTFLAPLGFHGQSIFVRPGSGATKPAVARPSAEVQSLAELVALLEG